MVSVAVQASTLYDKDSLIGLYPSDDGITSAVNLKNVIALNEYVTAPYSNILWSSLL